MTDLDRTQYIGGSDVAAILKLSNWRTPLDVYRAKKGLLEEVPPDPDRERRLRRGTLMEPVIIQMLEAEHPYIKITKRATPEDQNRHFDPEIEFLGAQIDFEWEVTREAVREFPEEIDPALVGTTQNGEVKSMHPFVAKRNLGEEKDDFPIEYHTQAIHGLSVTGRQLALVPILVGSDDLMLYWSKRPPEAEVLEMRDRLARFWLDNVVAGVPPDPIDLFDVYKLLPRGVATRREATPALEKMIFSLKRLKERADITKEGIEALQYEIGVFLLGAEKIDDPKKSEKGKHIVTVAGQPELWVSLESQNRIDAEAVREQYPEVAASCSKTSTFYKFNTRRRS